MDHIDIDTSTAILEDLIEMIDGATAEELAPMLGALEGLRREVDSAISFARTEMLRHVEHEPVMIDGKVYQQKRKGKWRYDHERIGTIAARRARFDVNTGEERAAGDAVERLYQMMLDLYVSPSTPAKVGALQKMEITDRTDVAEWEHTGTELEVFEVPTEEMTRRNHV